LVGVLPDHLPFFSPPDLSLATLKQLAPSALAIALLGIVHRARDRGAVGSAARR
jgi:SulP family sulfate permease